MDNKKLLSVDIDFQQGQKAVNYQRDSGYPYHRADIEFKDVMRNDEGIPAGLYLVLSTLRTYSDSPRYTSDLLPILYSITSIMPVENDYDTDRERRILDLQKWYLNRVHLSEATAAVINLGCRVEEINDYINLLLEDEEYEASDPLVTDDWLELYPELHELKGVSRHALSLVHYLIREDVLAVRQIADIVKNLSQAGMRAKLQSRSQILEIVNKANENKSRIIHEMSEFTAQYEGITDEELSRIKMFFGIKAEKN